MQFQYYSVLFHVDFFSHQPDCRFLNMRNKVIKVIRLALCIFRLRCSLYLSVVSYMPALMQGISHVSSFNFYVV